jgi:uncharacterized protein (TIGR02594 family)
MPAAIKIISASTGDPCGAPPRVPSASSGDVYAENELVVRQDDAYAAHACPGAAPHGATASAGSAYVFINNEPAHRNGDAISCGSTGSNGASTVIIGDVAFSPSPAPSVVTLSGTGPAPAVSIAEDQQQLITNQAEATAERSVGDTGEQVSEVYPPTPDAAGVVSLGTTSGLVQPEQASPLYPGSTPAPSRTNPSNPNDPANPTNVDPNVAQSTATADQIPAFLSQLLQEAVNNQWDETVTPSNPNIIGLWQELGFPSSSYWQTDQTPWCAGFANWVLKKTGYRFMQSARAYDFRDKTSVYGGVPVPLSDGQPGDIVVWNYSHVNFIYSVPSPGVYTFVGGNQSDRASATNNNPSGGTITNSWPGGWRQTNGRISGIFRPVRA